MQNFTFINAFEIPIGEEEVFRQEWSGVIANLQGADGLRSVRLYEVNSEVEAHLLQVPGIATRLHERPDSRPSFHFVVVAEWESVAHYEAVVHTANQEPQEKPVISFFSHPAYYKIASEYIKPQTGV